MLQISLVQIRLKLLWKQISCCAPRFPLSLTAKFHSLYVKELESKILESRSRKFWKGRSRIFYLRLRKPGYKAGLPELVYTPRIYPRVLSCICVLFVTAMHV